MTFSRASAHIIKLCGDTKHFVVKSCGSRPEAELVKGALEEAGIQAIIQGDTAGRMREHLAWSGAGFRILVRKGDANRGARSVHFTCGKVTKVPTWIPKLTTTLSRPGVA